MLQATFSGCETRAGHSGIGEWQSVPPRYEPRR